MRGLLTLLGGALVTFLIVGWYFGWYEFRRETTSDGKQHIEFDLDTKKVKEDVHKGADRVGKAIHPAPAPAPAPPPK